MDGEIYIGREVAVRIGDGVAAKAAVAEVLVRIFRTLPGTFAQRQRKDVLPRAEAGLLAFGAYLDQQEKEVVDRQQRIERIQTEIDERAWELYR